MKNIIEVGNSLVVVEEFLFDDLLTVVVLDISDHWVLDTELSFHMTPNKNYFSFF